MKRWLRTILAAAVALLAAAALMFRRRETDHELIAQHDDLYGDDGFNVPDTSPTGERQGGGSR